MYEVTRDARPSTYHPLVEDPFLVRGFPEENGRGGEFYTIADTATIILNTPDTSREQLSRGEDAISLYFDCYKEL